jgi:hypothetical protein
MQVHVFYMVSHPAASNLYRSHIVANIFGNWLHDIDHRDRIFNGWDWLPYYGCYGYVQMIMFLMLKFFSYASYFLVCDACKIHA